MRLWHYKLLEFLPRLQIKGQWSELNCIFKTRKEHILINYVYEYDKKDLLVYTVKVIKILKKYGYNIDLSNASQYFGITQGDLLGIESKEDYIPFENHHNYDYLMICYYNLKEKYLRGQKDFSEELFNRLEDFINNELFNFLNETNNKLLEIEYKKEKEKFKNDLQKCFNKAIYK